MGKIPLIGFFVTDTYHLPTQCYGRLNFGRFFILEIFIHHLYFLKLEVSQNTSLIMSMSIISCSVIANVWAHKAKKPAIPWAQFFYL